MNAIYGLLMLLDTERAQQSSLDRAVVSIITESGVRNGLQQCEECREWVEDKNLEYICQASVVPALATASPSVHFTLKNRYPYFECPEGCSNQQKWADKGQPEHQICPVHVQAVYQMHGCDLGTMKKGFILTCPDCEFTSPLLESPRAVLLQVEQHLKQDSSASPAAAAGQPAPAGADPSTAATASVMTGGRKCPRLAAAYQKVTFSHPSAYGAVDNTNAPHASTLAAAAAATRVEPEHFVKRLLARIAVCTAVHVEAATRSNAGLEAAAIMRPSSSSAAAAAAPAGGGGGAGGADLAPTVSQVLAAAASSSTSSSERTVQLLAWREWALHCLIDPQILSLANWSRPRLLHSTSEDKASLLDCILSPPLRLQTVAPAAAAAAAAAAEFGGSLVLLKLVAVLKRLKQRHIRNAAVQQRRQQQQQCNSPPPPAVARDGTAAAAGGESSRAAGSTLTAKQLLRELLSQDCVFKHYPAQQRVSQFLQPAALGCIENLGLAMNSRAVNAAHMMLCAACGSKDCRDLHRCSNCVVCLCGQCVGAVADEEGGLDQGSAAAAAGEGFICTWCRGYNSRAGNAHAAMKHQSGRAKIRASGRAAAPAAVAAAAANDGCDSSRQADPCSLQQQQIVTPTAAAPQVRWGRPLPSSNRASSSASAVVSAGGPMSEAQLASAAAEFLRDTHQQLTQQQRSYVGAFKSNNRWRCVIPPEHYIPPGWMEIEIERRKEGTGHREFDTYYLPPDGLPSRGFTRFGIRSGPDIQRYLAVQPNQVQPDHAQQDQAELDQDEPDQDQPVQHRTYQGQADHDQTDDYPADQVQPDQDPPDQDPADQDPADQIQPDQVQPDQDLPDQVQSNQDLPDQHQPAEVQPDQVQPDQVGADQAQPDQTDPDHIHSDQLQLDQMQPDHVQPDQVLQGEAQPHQAQPDHVQLNHIQRPQRVAECNKVVHKMQQRATAAGGGGVGTPRHHPPQPQGTPGQQATEQQQEESQVVAENILFETCSTGHPGQQLLGVKKEISAAVNADQAHFDCIDLGSDDELEDVPQLHQQQQDRQQWPRQQEEQATNSRADGQHVEQSALNGKLASAPGGSKNLGYEQQHMQQPLHKQQQQQQQQQEVPRSQVLDQHQGSKRHAQVHEESANKRPRLPGSDSSAVTQPVNIKREPRVQGNPQGTFWLQQQQQQQQLLNRQAELQHHHQQQQNQPLPVLQTDAQQQQQEEQHQQHLEQQQEGSGIRAHQTPEQPRGDTMQQQQQQQHLLAIERDINAGNFQLYSTADLDAAAHKVLAAMQQKKLQLVNCLTCNRQAAASASVAAAAAAAGGGDEGLSISSSNAAAALDILLQITQLLLQLQPDHSKALLLHCLSSVCLVPSRSHMTAAAAAAGQSTVLDLLMASWVQEVRLTGCGVGQAAAAAANPVARPSPAHLAAAAAHPADAAAVHGFCAGLCHMVLHLITCAVTSGMTTDADAAVVGGCARPLVEKLVQQLIQGTSLLLRSHGASTGVGGVAAAAAPAVPFEAWNTQAGFWRQQVWCSLRRLQELTGTAAAALCDVCKDIGRQLQEMQRYLLPQTELPS